MELELADLGPSSAKVLWNLTETFWLLAKLSPNLKRIRKVPMGPPLGWYFTKGDEAQRPKTWTCVDGVSPPLAWAKHLSKNSEMSLDVEPCLLS